ncbi:Lacal_2735 family protein [Flavicella sediminum]|uniref:Lacal_2735 family protein n=1 Tax=Flavicella sediminum TaxID=2585141 RepID=UPI00111FDEF8|nr:Lacal_2735 family protein [Flavicella sediminum]
MFGIFKKKTKLELLQKEYEKLTQETFVLSKTSRAEGDKKFAEAELVLKKIKEEQEK